MSTQRASLYNRYRPYRFADLVGQEHVVRGLGNSLTAGQPAHGYLFSGPRGTGKTTTARILARCLNCQRSDGPTPDPCGECDSCLRTGEEGWLDVVEVDAASSARRIDEMRDWLETVRYAPAASRYRITIMDEAHQIQDQAASALLKTLEEPPPHLVVMLCTTHPWDILPTIRSRLQHYGLRKPGVANLVKVLDSVARKEQIETSEAALDLVARAADGSYRDALGLLDQIAAFGNGRVDVADAMDLLGVVERQTIFDLVDHLALGNAGGSFELLEQATAGGADPEHLLRSVANHLRFVCLLQQGAEPREDWAVADVELDRLRAQANQLPATATVRGLDLIADAQVRIRHGGADPAVQLELIVAKLARPELDGSMQALASRVEQLEAGRGPLPAAAPAAAGPAPAALETVDDPPPTGPPPPPPSSEPVPLDLDHLERLWPHVLADFERESPRVGAFLGDSRPIEASDGTVRIAVASELAHQLLSQPVDHRMVQDVLCRQLRQQVQVELVLAARASPANEQAEPPPPVQDHRELIDEIKRAFDAVEEPAPAPSEVPPTVHRTEPSNEET